MPAQDRVRREQRADFFNPLATEGFTFDRQATSLGVGEENSLAA